MTRLSPTMPEGDRRKPNQTPQIGEWLGWRSASDAAMGLDAAAVVVMGFGSPYPLTRRRGLSPSVSRSAIKLTVK